MKRFILRTILIATPLVGAFLSNFFLGARTKGDLLRVGYLLDETDNYRDEIWSELSDTLYIDFSNINKSKRSQYVILNIGDSFSQLGSVSYQNYLASFSEFSVIHFNKMGNSIEILNSMINGSALDSLNVDFVILQSVEREVVKRATYFDSTKTLTFSLAKKIDKIEKIKNQQRILKYKDVELYTDAVVKFPLHNFLYNFDDNAFISKVYKVKLNSDVFQNNEKDLLFLDEDLFSVDTNNNFQLIKNLNNKLNSLSKKLLSKGIKLIVLISPDKYDMYYSFIEKKDNYPEPKFFTYLNRLDKEYIYIESKGVLLDAMINNMNDIYYFDDTHWTPFSAQIIANEIKKRLDIKMSEK